MSNNIYVTLEKNIIQQMVEIMQFEYNFIIELFSTFLLISKNEQLDNFPNKSNENMLTNINKNYFCTNLIHVRKIPMIFSTKFILRNNFPVTKQTNTKSLYNLSTNYPITLSIQNNLFYSYRIKQQIRCIYIFKYGTNKGKQCPRKMFKNGYCNAHYISCKYH